MKPQSAKAKGRALQQWVVDKLVELLGFDPEDLESRPMGSNGEDIIMGVQSRKQFTNMDQLMASKPLYSRTPRIQNKATRPSAIASMDRLRPIRLRRRRPAYSADACLGPTSRTGRLAEATGVLMFCSLGPFPYAST